MCPLVMAQHGMVMIWWWDGLNHSFAQCVVSAAGLICYVLRRYVADIA